MLKRLLDRSEEEYNRLYERNRRWLMGPLSKEGKVPIWHLPLHILNVISMYEAAFEAPIATVYGMNKSR